LARTNDLGIPEEDTSSSWGLPQIFIGFFKRMTHFRVGMRRGKAFCRAEGRDIHLECGILAGRVEEIKRKAA
jgi:hypothetical protein